MPGTLFLVATPIGNLGDMTPRALQVLTDADLIAAEDTRRTLQLLNHFSIKGKLIHYDENNKEKQGPVLLQELLQGNNVALVTDAGFPGISDPGEAMAKLAIENGITVTPVPGANACLTALVASGLPSHLSFSERFCQKAKRTGKSSWKNGNRFPRPLCYMKHHTGLWKCWKRFWQYGVTGRWPLAGS